MNIQIVTPARAGSLKGNRVTADRWARLLRRLGHRVSIDVAYRRAKTADLLIALHARRSAPAIRRYRSDWPERPLIVALTGTDLYRDLKQSRAAHDALDLATRLVVLQPDAIRHLPRHHQAKARVIYQSLPRPRASAPPLKRLFEVVVMGHLRPVKDPFRCALAARQLPSCSRIRVQHVGAALSSQMKRRAEREMEVNPRYRWHGELPRGRALRRLARARLLVLTSRLEGGANVITEAIVAGTPVLSSLISGSIGLLGPDYAGYFAVGDTRHLSELLWRAERDRGFYQQLQAQCAAVRPRFDPQRESQSWRELLEDLSV